MTLKLKKAPLILKRYIEYLENKGYSDRTIEHYASNIDRFFRYLISIDIKDLKDVDKNVLHRYQDHLYRETSLSLSSQESALCAVIIFFRYLDHTDQILYNPAGSIELPRRPMRLPRKIFSETQMKKLLNAPDIEKDLGLRDRAILEVFYSTGMRNTELRKLKLYDVDFDGKQVVIYEGKGKKSRVIPVGETALLYIREYLERVRPKLIKNEDEKTLFLSARGGQRLRRKALARIVQRYAYKIRIADPKDNTGPHMIRHSFASHVLRRGAPIRYIQEMLGHKSLDTTKRYTKVEIQDLKKIHKKTHPREIGL